VEEYLVATFEKEVSSQTIGEKVAEVLRRVDKVAYVRFASVYRQFEDVGDFIEEARDVMERSERDVPGSRTSLKGRPSREEHPTNRRHEAGRYVGALQPHEAGQLPGDRDPVAAVRPAAGRAAGQCGALHLQDWSEQAPPTTSYIYRCVRAVLQQTGLADVADELMEHPGGGEPAGS